MLFFIMSCWVFFNFSNIGINVSYKTMNYVQPGNIETNLYFQVSLPLCLLMDQLKYMYPTLKKYTGILFYHLQYMEYSWNKFHFTFPFPRSFCPCRTKHNMEEEDKFQRQHRNEGLWNADERLGSWHCARILQGSGI